MKKKDIFIWSVSLISIVVPAMPATAQNDDEKKKTISLPEEPTPLPDAVSKPELLPDSTTSFPISSTELFSPDLFLSPYSSTLRFNPAMWNYHLSDTTKRWSSRLSLTLFNQQATYIGLGEYNNIGASLLWSPTDKLSLKTSAFISKQFGYILPSRQVLYGMGFMLNYEITNKLLFRAWGQYVTPGDDDPFLNMTHLFPKTKIGADLQYKATEKTEVGVGIEYQYDKKENTWKPESGGKVKIGF